MTSVNTSWRGKKLALFRVPKRRSAPPSSECRRSGSASPSVIHAVLMPRLIGWGRARWLMMTAESIDAQTALASGLIDRIASPGGLDAAFEQTVAMLLACGPEAVRAHNALLRRWEELPLEEAVDLSAGVFAQCFLTGEPQRLMRDFINRKR
jgi:enoyl-CoA hydratase